MIGVAAALVATSYVGASGDRLALFSLVTALASLAVGLRLPRARRIDLRVQRRRNASGWDANRARAWRAHWHYLAGGSRQAALVFGLAAAVYAVGEPPVEPWHMAVLVAAFPAFTVAIGRLTAEVRRLSPVQAPAPRRAAATPA